MTILLRIIWPDQTDTCFSSYQSHGGVMAGADVAYKEGDAAQWGRIKGGIPKEAKAYLGAIVAIQQLGSLPVA